MLSLLVNLIAALGQRVLLTPAMISVSGWPPSIRRRVTDMTGLGSGSQENCIAAEVAARACSVLLTSCRSILCCSQASAGFRIGLV